MQSSCASRLINGVAPARERGLKLQEGRKNQGIPRRRSREGAWIEMADTLIALITPSVAPARERGLKSCGQCLGCRLDKSLPRGSVD